MTWQSALLLIVGIGGIAAAFMLDPIPQNLRYHEFADQRSLGGIPNFLNVVSNLPFLLVGALGWRAVATGHLPVSATNRRAWLVFFAGIALTAIGSAWFHWRPDNSSLIWDRLPMTIGFMSLFSIILAEYLSADLGRRALLPLLVSGAASVAWWAYTESQGAGDLRPYAVVQFLPMLLTVLILLLYRTRSDLNPYIWLMFSIYVAAKAAEYFDAELLLFGDILSGHSLKHLLASLAPASLLYALIQRQKSRDQVGKHR